LLAIHREPPEIPPVRVAETNIARFLKRVGLALHPSRRRKPKKTACHSGNRRSHSAHVAEKEQLGEVAEWSKAALC
jgi:hypothetical protein